jgi:hypothetical protein
VRSLVIVTGIGAALLALSCKPEHTVKERNEEPQAEISSPLDGQEVKEGVYFLASGRVSDSDDPTEQLMVTWFSEGEARCMDLSPMADGRTECGMSIGTEDADIELYVEDPSGDSYQASVRIKAIPATGPGIEIIAPEPEGYTLGEKLLFQGTVSDGEDVATALRVWWWSDLDGELDIDLAQDDDGSVIGYYEWLSLGTHVLRLWAEDTSGRANSAEVLVNILPEPAPPVVTINSPLDGSDYTLGDSVLFEATIGDERTPVIELSIEWTSSLDDILSTAATDSLGKSSFTVETLSEGSHEIFLSVTDGDGMTNTEHVSLTVSAR